MTPSPGVLVVDTDTGIDDAMALVHALLDNAPIELITTVHGNSDVDSCTRNALELLELTQTDIPVARGAQGPIIQGCGAAPQIHGIEGRGSLPAPVLRTRPVPGHAVQRILEMVASNPSEVTIVAMGRLTNVALACLLEPQTMKSVRKVVWMGGAVSVSGNTSPVAEANLDGDPEALRIVLAHGVPLTILPLDVTMDVRLTQDDLNSLAASAHRAVVHLTRLVPFYLDAYEAILGVRECALHCGLLMGIVMDPSLVTASTRLPVTVELQGEHTRGMLVVDRREARGVRTPAVPSDIHTPEIITGVDGQKYKAQFLAALLGTTSTATGSR
ncbi:nucleoside hydrolase [Streptomyces sp. NPDC059477]|uniref:nucleoside hydrolase n=1 Tax=Streptomyces sp. NPDC059477 TaxID=3346847 RepID=UPI0036952730